MKKEIANVFDVFSEGYSEKMIRFVPHYKKMLHAILHYLPPNFKPQNILELGCGNGNVTALLLQQFPNVQIMAVDASAEMIQICKKRFSEVPNIEYGQVFFQEIKWTSSKYDLIVAGLSLHHLEGHEKRQIFKKINKALTGKGVFSCADLLIEKDDNPHHENVLKEWEQFMMNSKSSEEEWAWIMDHYDKYDRPNSFENQSKWMEEANFLRIKLSWNTGPWGCYHAYKT